MLRYTMLAIAVLGLTAPGLASSVTSTTVHTVTETAKSEAMKEGKKQVTKQVEKQVGGVAKSGVGMPKVPGTKTTSVTDIVKHTEVPKP